jgi:hypothetical protein
MRSPRLAPPASFARGRDSPDGAEYSTKNVFVNESCTAMRRGGPGCTKLYDLLLE